MRAFFLSKLIGFLYWLFYRSWRYKETWHPDARRRFESGPGGVYAHWHTDELIYIGLFSKRNMTLMSSQSRDGEIMARWLTAFGYHVVRGSSSRGGAAALVKMVRDAKKLNKGAALAVDGPRGPIYQVKPGIVLLAQKLGEPIIPSVAWANRKWVFHKAWNKSYLPKFFSTIHVYQGEPIPAPDKKLSPEEMDAFCAVVSEKMKKMKADICREFGGESEVPEDLR
jgi:lysophospholipid acyltransferase (LPLAT)-like uncharacterized protein